MGEFEGASKAIRDSEKFALGEDADAQVAGSHQEPAGGVEEGKAVSLSNLEQTLGSIA
ncbi:MAG: hypothetical protein AAGF53_09515 [Pseudomonadota bacterium]